MATNNKPVAELRIGAVKATIGKTRSAASLGATSPFRGSTATATSGRPHRASASTTCSPSPSSPIRRTR